MEEKHRGLSSLRRKRTQKPRPVISAPRQISAPIAQPSIPSNTSTTFGNGAFSTERPALVPSVSSSTLNSRVSPSRGGDTADYIKRRYSTRIPQLPKDFDEAPPLPTHNLPVIPPARSANRKGGNRPTDKITIDIAALQDPQLKPDQYVAQLLANASEQDIREYQADLSKIKNRTSTDLSHNVYQNRNQFIKISQEADKLKGEMRVLRSLMSDLTSTLGQTNAALGISTDNLNARKYANRSSVANLEAMWSTHLQELWRRVEGSQKFLPAIPGRHVVHESGRWVELNTATWKPKKRVHMILLNDHLLVAAEKKRIETDKSTLKPAMHQPHVYAEYCWPLQDVEVVDISGKAGTSAPPGAGGRRGSKLPTQNAVSIRMGSDAFTYMATDSEGTEKSSLLARFRKAVADLRKHLQVDSAVDERKVSGSRSPSGRPLSSRVASGHGVVNGSIDAATSQMSSRGKMLVEIDGRQQDYHWVETQVDELDIDIALQRFDGAVDRVETLRRTARSNKGNLMVQELVNVRVAEKADRLAKAIIKQLVGAGSSMTQTQQHVVWLTNLGFEGRASEAYLDSRSEVVRLRISQCADTGDLHVYLYQLSYIYFKLLRNTVAIYQACFPQNMTSAVVKWAKEHVDEFNTILARQLSKIEKGGEEWGYCIQRARQHAAMLNEVGIDFSSFIGKFD